MSNWILLVEYMFEATMIIGVFFYTLNHYNIVAALIFFIITLVTLNSLRPNFETHSKKDQNNENNKIP